MSDPSGEIVLHEFEVQYLPRTNRCSCSCGRWAVSTDINPNADHYRIEWLCHVVADLQAALADRGGQQ